MAQIKFLSIRELQQQGSGIKETLTGDGKIIITHNGKPIGITVGVSEDTLEEILEDWRKVKNLRYMRYIDRKLDESEAIAASKDAQWIEEDDFWMEPGLNPL